MLRGMKEQPVQSPVAGVETREAGGAKLAPWNPQSQRDWVAREQRRLGPFFFIFGIILPLIALGFELLTHGCADLFFDPVPSWWHVTLVAAVPFTNFLIWRGLRAAEWRPARGMFLLAGASIGISTVYGLMFLPL